MQVLSPKVILFASSHIHTAAFDEFREAIGAKEFAPEIGLNGEAIIEVGGRLCYKSFALGLNRNVTKIRHDSYEYHKNILAQKHGSVLEHASVTFVILNCSRIFTHEIVRHRAGMAVSQESMRFVRLDNIGMYYPKAFQTDDKIVTSKIKQIFENTVRSCEIAIEEIGSLLKIDEHGTPFDVKKKITSALRRLAPGGHTTNIMLTANHRAWRHILAARSSPGAEEEMWPIMKDIGTQLKNQFPMIYQDMFLAEDKSDPKHTGRCLDSWAFDYNKV